MGSTGSDIFGGITFVLIAALALAAVAVIIYGRYLKQRRLAGEKELIERREAAHVDAVVVEPEAPLKEDLSAPVEPVDDAAVDAPAQKVKATPRAKAATRSPEVEAAPKAKPAARAKAAPKPETVTQPVPAKSDSAPKAKAPPKPKTAPKAEVAAPTALPKAPAAPKTKAEPAPSKTAPTAAAAPKAEPATPPAPATDGDITQLKGLGPKLATTLAELGYTRLDQIAALTPAQATDLDAKLGAFQGRMARDRWIEQATLLVAGDRAAYEAAFGKLG